MQHYEYKVIPAPRKGLKGKGIKGAEARFAYAIQTLMNTQAGDGWEFVRAETLPSDERHGLASAQTVYRDLLVFRRARAADEPLVDDLAVEQHEPDDTDEGPDPQESSDTPDDMETPADAESGRKN